MRVAYLINMYPKGSHTFIRREILEVERQGVSVERFALRGWDSNPVDPIDREELAKTRHTLRDGLLPLLKQAIVVAVSQPRLFFRAVRSALAMSKNGARPWPYHLIYVAHAARILTWLKDSDVTHLHAHFGTNSAEIASLIHTLGGPTYSFIVHGAEVLDNPSQHALPIKVKDAKFALGSCAYAASQMMYHVDPSLWDRIKVVHCGLPNAVFETTPAPLPEHPVFLSISRFSAEKGHVLLLRAFADVLKSHPNAKLLLVGDGPMEDQLRAQVKDLGITNAVVFEGWLDSDAVQAKIRQASALVHPSFSEGLPVVIMEAMTEHRPVISTYIAGIPELVKEGETGWLIPAGQEHELMRAMNDCASRPHKDLVDMGAAGFERVRARHHIRTEAKKLIGFFAAEHIS
jgi:glycosyltransferase involved in cell wall biosynthesis